MTSLSALLTPRRVALVSTLAVTLTLGACADPRDQRMLDGALIGGAGGAVIGGAAGAAAGSFGRGIGIGAAAGAASGLVHGIIKASEPTPVFKNFMIQCLQDRGYQPIGWE